MESEKSDSLSGFGNTIQNPLITNNGNKKQSDQNIKWCFTFNNYSESDIVDITTLFKSVCKAFVFQEEIGDNGTPHLQGFIYLKKRMRWTELGLCNKIHWEKCKDAKASMLYCQKLDTRKLLSLPTIYGDIVKPPAEIKIISNLYKWQRDIETIFFSEPDHRVIHWYYETTGNVGKSAFTKYMVVKHNCLFCDGGKKSDLLNLIYNNDMDMCRGIIFDIPRSAGGNVSYATLEAIKNGLVCNTKYETGVKAFNAPHVFVFANLPPTDPEKLSEDRWDIHNIDDLMMD